jgi:hypothetical protein
MWVINHVESIKNLNFQDKADALIVENFIIPLIVSFFVSRVCAYLMARIWGYKSV